MRGHGPGQEVLQTGKRAVEIVNLEPVGSYAVQPRFSDGHDTGIYSWDYLYELGRTASGGGRSTSRASARRARAGTERRCPAAADFGFKQVPEDDKARQVAGVFDSVAPRYDLMNDLMSLGLHRAWKAFAVAVSGVREGQRVLDVAGGSGDLARAFARRVGASGEVWLTDINAAMLGAGRDRLLDAGLAAPLAQCDAERLPFRSGSFDCVSVAFGLRNMTRKEAALAEMARVLKPGGRLLVLEFSKVWKPLEKALRLVLVQRPPPARAAVRSGRGKLPLPRRVDPHAPRPGSAAWHDRTRRAGRRRIL